MSNLHDRQKSLTAQIERLKAERSDRLETLKQALKNAIAVRAGERVIEEKSRALTDYDELSLFALDNAKAELAEVEAAIKGERETVQAAGRAELQTMKAQARDKWLAAGGTDASFSEAWPEMERDILKQRIGPADGIGADAIAAKRSMISPL